MEKDYCYLAADWWTKSIESNQNSDVIKLDLFKEELSSEIRSITSQNPSMVISTWKKRSNLLSEIAFRTGLVASDIPSGYEMRILFDNIFVYNYDGKLISSF